MKRTRSPLAILALAAFLAAPKGFAVAEASGGAPAPVPHIAAVPLTSESFGKLLNADQKLAGVFQRDRNLELATAASGNQDAIDSWKRRFDSNPKVTEALKTAGMTPSEYFATLLSLLQAAAVSDYKKLDKPAPASLLKLVPPANLAFVQSHPSEVTAWMRKSGTPQVHPNTIEDMYVAQASVPAAAAEPAPVAQTQAAATPPAKKKTPASPDSQPTEPKPPAPSNP